MALRTHYAARRRGRSVKTFGEAPFFGERYELQVKTGSCMGFENSAVKPRGRESPPDGIGQPDSCAPVVLRASNGPGGLGQANQTRLLSDIYIS